MDLEKINETINDLPNTALALMPDDAILLHLVSLLPRPVTKENAKTMMVVMSLICRRMSRAFDEMATAQEKLVREWQS